jgi:hypothetical protein
MTDQEVAGFTSAVRSNGWQASDFELQEDAFDQQKAEVEARKGEVGIRCLRTGAVTVYPLQRRARSRNRLRDTGAVGSCVELNALRCRPCGRI